MILYIFQSFLWYYKYRYGTFYSQNYRVIPSVSICYIDVIHLHQSWQKKKIKFWEFATLQSHEFILKWRIRVIPPGQIFKALTPRHSITTHIQVNFYLFPWLTLSVQTLLWGSHAPAAQPPGITGNHRQQYLPWIHRAAVPRLRASQSLPPETGGLSRARNAFQHWKCSNIT